MIHILVDERIKLELSTLYPNGIITSLSVTNISLHNQINLLAKRKNMSYSHYLESIGFTHENKRGRNKKPYEEKLEELLVELNNAFPNKLIEAFSSHPLYSRTYNLCKEINIDMDVFLSQQVFHYKNLSGQTHTQDVVNLDKNNHKYDINTMRNLCSTYGLNQTVFSGLFGVKRQAISGIINRKNKHSNNWVVTEMDQSSLSTFEQMIMDYEKVFITENEQFFICSDGDTEQPAFCFFYTLKIENEVLCHCLYDIPVTLRDLLLERHFHLFKQQHLTFIKELRMRDEEWSAADEPEPYYLSKEERETVNFLIRNYKHLFVDFPAFCDFLGFQHIAHARDRRETMDERYYKILSSFYVPELDIVKIPSADKRNYINMSRAAKKRGMGLKEFIESFGFNYKRVVNVNLEEKKEKHLAILSPYILEDGKIYISSFDPVYTKFYILANNSKRTLTSYLKDEFDLDRYVHINDVPAHLTPKIEKTTYTEAKEEALIEKIKDFFLIDESLQTVYIPTASSFYGDLYKYCDSLDKDIDEVLNGWGYTRLLKNQLEIQEEPPLNTEELVELLAVIQSSVNKSDTEFSKQKRSQRLVSLLKEIYEYKCQLCGDHPIIPIIPMENGKNYVEVHHIVPLHKQNVMNDESDIILDDYENAIVLCAHHHKVLHYENTGYVDIKKIDEKLYFVNKENKIHIQKTYHLTENDHLLSKLVNTI